MLTLNSFPESIEEQLRINLLRIETACVGHFRASGFCDPRLRPLFPLTTTAIGTAVTLDIPGKDSTILHYAMGRVRPHDFVVISRRQESELACWGGFMAASARIAGIAGVIVDGMVTDLPDLRKSAVPVWSRGVSPMTTRIGSPAGGLNVPIRCGGVTVNPGDVVVADESGILILPRHEAENVFAIASSLQSEEEDDLKQLRSGVAPGVLTGADEMVLNATVTGDNGEGGLDVG